MHNNAQHVCHVRCQFAGSCNHRCDNECSEKYYDPQSPTFVARALREALRGDRASAFTEPGRHVYCHEVPSAVIVEAQHIYKRYSSFMRSHVGDDCL